MLRRRDGKALGTQRASRGRSRGKQEQIIPTLVSTELHVAAGGLSYVGSRELEIETRDCRRRIDTMHTLQGRSLVRNFGKG
jgi:hypothetical protein